MSDSKQVTGPGATVVVTGGSGFIGSAVVREALSRGCAVTALIRECEPIMDLDGLNSRVVDWDDRIGFTEVLSEISPDVIVHCAGSSARGQEAVEAIYRANVGLVWTLLSAVTTACPTCGVVLLSSAAVYGPSPEVPTSEAAVLQPATHYGHSKVLAEGVARAFAEVEGVRAVVARPFNVLGPGEPAGSVVERIAHQVAGDPGTARVEVRLREVSSVRDFVDVDDVARALVAIGFHGEAGTAYNICSGRGVSIRDLVECAVAVSGRESDLLVEQEDTVASVSIGRNDRLGQLGWTPRIPLEESMRRIMQSALLGSAVSHGDGE